MSDKEESTPENDINKQLQDLLGGAQVQFMFGQQPGGTATAEPSGEGGAAAAPDKSEKVLARIRDFNLKPREVRDFLDRFVIKQADAKKVLSVAICDHYNHVRQCLENAELREKSFAKQNVLLMGPTGVGKTYLLRCIAKLIGVPFVKADATKFSETGYVGYDVEDIVRDLVRMADGNTELAQYGIVYIDEIDKIASQTSQNGGKDVSGRGVQINLLKLMEDTEVNLFSQTDILGQMQAMMEMQRGKSQARTMNTRHVLFIVSGAFDKLGECVQKRIDRSHIGFQKQGDEKKIFSESDYIKLVQAEDFISYGFEPEFIGRLPIRVACDALNSEDLEQILLKSEDSVLEQYREDFRGYGIEFRMSREAISAIARQAEGEKTGARGLMTKLERVFRNFKYELPSTSITEFAVNEETITDPMASLRELLKQNITAQRGVLKKEVELFAARFNKEFGLTLQFTEDAVTALVERSLETDRTIRSICEGKFKDFQFGLKLISAKTGRTQFEVTREVVEDPDKELSRWVAENYPRQEG